jgi:hypothetical protein
VHPSVGAAYKSLKGVLNVSNVALYAKINGLEPKIIQELLRFSNKKLSVIRDEFITANQVILKEYEIRIIDGNHIAGTEHRLEVLRGKSSAALPAQSLAILDPQRELVVDIFPEEDAHAQERSIFPQALKTIKKKELWIADRNFCTHHFLGGISEKEAFFIIRENLNIGWTELTTLEKKGKNGSGTVFEQQVKLNTPVPV